MAKHIIYYITKDDDFYINKNNDYYIYSEENIEDDNPVNFIKYKAYLYKDDKFIKLKSYVKDTQVKPHIYMV